MSELPELQPGDLGNLVDSLFAGDAARRRSHLVAVLGTGAPGLVRTQVGEFAVVPVRSEIELRRQLPPLDLDPTEALEIRQVFLVPWDELPLDISGRFAGHGRVLTLPRVSLLRARLGVEEVDASVLECRLADYLLRAPRIRLPGMGRLTESLLWQAWLASEWHTPADLNMPEMLVWAASDGRGPQFAAVMATRGAEGGARRADAPAGSPARRARTDPLERVGARPGPRLAGLRGDLRGPRRQRGTGGSHLARARRQGAARDRRPAGLERSR
jgi:hypothetical protein